MLAHVCSFGANSLHLGYVKKRFFLPHPRFANVPRGTFSHFSHHNLVFQNHKIKKKGLRPFTFLKYPWISF